MVKILLTGGAGFIGSHVAEALLARGDQVTVLDNFNDFYDPAIKRGNASFVQAAGGVIVEGDIRDEKLIDELFENGDFDGVVHLAAMAGVRPSLLDPLHYEDVNVRGTLILLERIKKHAGMPFVFASSSSVYGGNKDVPFSESHEIHHPVSPYAATKRAGELMCYTYHHLYNIPTSCLRFFTVYGPRQRPEMAIHKFVRAVFDGQPIPFYGDGTTERDYTYIDDIVSGVLKSLDHCKGYEIFNLGESETTSLSSLVEQVGQACGTEPILDRQPMQPGDVLITFADISKAKSLIGYAPKTLIPEGLKRFVAWFRAQNPLVE
jgi:UDP-glucuronate 4-epimerase